MRAADDMDLSMTVNGDPIRLAVSPHARLIDVLREDLELTGAKLGCGEGECGACSVLLDGKVVNSCLVLAAECDGRGVVTIEGLAGMSPPCQGTSRPRKGMSPPRQGGEKLHPVQRAFIARGAIQCGYCSPGMILAAYALLEQHQSPTEQQVRRALEGNLCRCTGYRKIIDAVLSVNNGERRDD